MVALAATEEVSLNLQQYFFEAELLSCTASQGSGAKKPATLQTRSHLNYWLQGIRQLGDRWYKVLTLESIYIYIK